MCVWLTMSFQEKVKKPGLPEEFEKNTTGMREREFRLEGQAKSIQT